MKVGLWHVKDYVHEVRPHSFTNIFGLVVWGFVFVLVLVLVLSCLFVCFLLALATNIQAISLQENSFAGKL